MSTEPDREVDGFQVDDLARHVDFGYRIGDLARHVLDVVDDTNPDVLISTEARGAVIDAWTVLVGTSNSTSAIGIARTIVETPHPPVAYIAPF